MSNWDEYKAKAKGRGALALELYVVTSTKAPDGDIPTYLPDHLAYQAQMEAQEKLAFAGPMSDASGQENSGDGLIIYRASSLAEATEMAAADPMHVSGTRSFTVRKWLVNEGSFSVQVGLSGKSVSMS